MSFEQLYQVITVSNTIPIWDTKIVNNSSAITKSSREIANNILGAEYKRHKIVNAIQKIVNSDKNIVKCNQEIVNCNKQIENCNWESVKCNQKIVNWNKKMVNCSNAH